MPGKRSTMRLLIVLLAFFRPQILMAFLVTSKRSSTPIKGCSSLLPLCNGANPLQESSTEKSKKKKKTVKEAKSKTKKNVKARASVQKVVKGSSTPTKKATKTTKGKKAKRKKTKESGPEYWIVDSDKFVLEFGNSNTTQGVSLLHFKVRGNPRPLRRHRTAYGRMYNPSEKLQDSFRDAVDKLIFTNGTVQKPLFDGDECLVMTIILSLKRPKKDFVGNKPGVGRLRENAPPRIAQTRTDVDNLVKFVFDSMNEILYEDDRQIMSVHVIKLLDNEDMCEGSTEVILRSIKETDVDQVILNSLNFVDRKED